MLEMGFQIISCPVGGEPTAIVLPYDDAAFIVTEMPYLEVDPEGWHEDIEERIGLTDGNIRHLDMIPQQMMSRRPLPQWSDYRTPIDALYLCGAGTHPGGEVTGAPGHNAAHIVLEDLTS